MKTWIISDTHFGHDKMVDYCGRPENHSDLIMNNLRIIQDNSILIHLGDFCIGQDFYWHKKFMFSMPFSTKVLVRGNHDKKSNCWYINHGWDFVCESFEYTYQGEKLLFSHIPLKNPQYINIHGHLHNNLHRLTDEPDEYNFSRQNYTDKHKLFCLENVNYKPLILSHFLSL